MPGPMENLEKGKVHALSYNFQETGKQVEYRLYVPTAYTPDKKTPLMVLLHGFGSNPEEIMNYAGVIEEAEKRGYIVVTPYGYSSVGWYGALTGCSVRKSHLQQIAYMGTGFTKLIGFVPGEEMDKMAKSSETDVLNVTAIVCANFNVDGRRVYLAGHSMGGAGTLHIGGRYPNVWAALAAMCPGMPKGDKATMAQETSGLPTWICAGLDDKITPIEPIQEYVAKRRLLEPPVKLTYIEMPEDNHMFPAEKSQMDKILSFFDDEFDQHPSEEKDIIQLLKVACDKSKESPPSAPNMWRFKVAMLWTVLSQIFFGEK